MNQVRFKTHNFRNFSAGAYGNSLRQWSSLGQLLDSNYRGTVTMRFNGRNGSGPCLYDIGFADVPRAYQEWLGQGHARERIFFNETAPNHRAVLQGEFYPDPRFGGALHYSTLPLPMRPALVQGARNHLGPGARLILRRLMSPSSYADFEAVTEKWPDSALELSIFSIPVGSIPGRNTIIWEVRNY